MVEGDPFGRGVGSEVAVLDEPGAPPAPPRRWRPSLKQAAAASYILEDVTERPYIMAGAAAFLLLLPLALTSTKGWIRRLGKNWTRLHRLVYLAAPLALLHYTWKQKSDIRDPLIVAVVLAVLLGVRLWYWGKGKRRRGSGRTPRQTSAREPEAAASA